MTIRLGFFGAGFIARYHETMLSDSGTDYAVVSVFDPDMARAKRFAALTGATVATSIDGVLDCADAVYICTWTSTHPELVARSAERGLAVFCEKPLATTLAGSLAMANQIAAAGVINQVGLVLRDSPALSYLRVTLRRQALGRVMSMIFRDDQFLPVQGLYESNWRIDSRKAGSGVVLEHSIHDLDLMEWLLGPIAKVNGRSASFHGIAGIEDVACAMMAFESGAIGSLTTVWHDVLERPSLRRIEVFCERGYLWLDDDVAGPVHVHVTGEEPVAVGGTALVDALLAEGQVTRNPDGSFIESVLSNTHASPDFSDALRAHVIADAIYRSAMTDGSTVAVDQAW
ncbi:MAG: Gfo/Idh/MocA family oxidoreductase [Actinomycetes bacterium]